MGQLLMKIHVELAGQCTFPSAGEEMPNGIESLGDFGTMSGSAENSSRAAALVRWTRSGDLYPLDLSMTQRHWQVRQRICHQVNDPLFMKLIRFAARKRNSSLYVEL